MHIQCIRKVDDQWRGRRIVGEITRIAPEKGRVVFESEIQECVNIRNTGKERSMAVIMTAKKTKILRPKSQASYQWKSGVFLLKVLHRVTKIQLMRTAAKKAIKGHEVEWA